MLKRKEIKVGGPRAFELCPQSLEGRELSVAVGPGVVLHCDSQSSEQLFRLGSNPGTSGLSRHDRCIRVGQVPSMTSSCGITNKNLTKITKIQDGITHQQDRTEPADSATHSRHDRHPFSPRQTPSRPAPSASPHTLPFLTSANRAQSSPWQPTKGDGHGRRQPQCMRWDQQTPVLTALGSHHAILLLGCGTVDEAGPRRVRIPNSTLPTLLVAKRVLQRRPSTCFSTPSDHQPAQGGTRQQAQWPANFPERALRA